MEVLQFSEQQTKHSHQFGSHTELHYHFHFNALISCYPKSLFGAEIVCSFFSQLPFLIRVLGLMQQQVSWNIQAKTQLPRYFWNGMMCGKSTSLQTQLFHKTFFSKWGWAQDTGWTLEQSKFCSLVMFDVTVLLNISFPQHSDVSIQLERALGLETHSHALEKTAPKIQSLTMHYPEKWMFWNNQMLPTQDQKTPEFSVSRLLYSSWPRMTERQMTPSRVSNPKCFIPLHTIATFSSYSYAVKCCMQIPYQDVFYNSLK